MRCASPSRGTLLAGENIDIFLSVLTNLVGLIPGVGGTPLYEVTKRIALEIIRSRTVPSLVPGLEAMIPQSPLVALLNNLETLRAAGAMGVIAGDIESGQLAQTPRRVRQRSHHLRGSRQRPRRQHRRDVSRRPSRPGGLRLRPGRRRQPLQLLPQSAHTRRARRLACGARAGERPPTSTSSRPTSSSPCRCCVRCRRVPVPTSRSSSSCRESWART